MKRNWATKVLALLLSFALLVTLLPAAAFADEKETAEIDAAKTMIAGNVEEAFVEAGTVAVSEDPSIAWVDENGNLNAMREGTTKITVGDAATTVSVKPYIDDSGIVGNLRILARFNDDMKFYDGHVYLLFTSYQDNVQVCVPDLYAAYEISDQYYRDIREDISNGSNHTTSETKNYFSFTDRPIPMVLNRGEIVTIGMYRDFDLTVPQAALGSLENSTLYKSVSDTVKKGLAELFFNVLRGEKQNGEKVDIKQDFNAIVEQVKAICNDENVSIEGLLDGVVGGGVCFNRELYNQKLEWDQYENVTCGMDITRNQLAALQEALKGNYNNFSILKNSCATVALRGWNAAVGTRNGQPTAYYLEAKGEGIFAIMDAPKTVRDGIKAKLPGYCLNNAQGVAEEGMGFQDETGWVYVSSPAKVGTTYAYEGEFAIDETRTSLPALVRGSEGTLVYANDAQMEAVNVSFETSENEGLTTVNKINFAANGSQAVFSKPLEGGIWFKTPAAEGSYVVDGTRKVLPSVYEDGSISFLATAFPFTYQVVSEAVASKNVLETKLFGPDKKPKATATVTVADGAPSALDNTNSEFRCEAAAGDKIHVEITFGMSEYLEDYKGVRFACLSDITLNGASVLDKAVYENSKYVLDLEMPDTYSTLMITTQEGLVASNYSSNLIQAFVGDTLKAEDLVQSSGTECYLQIGADPKGILEEKDGVITVKGVGSAAIQAVPAGNPVGGVLETLFLLETFASRKERVTVTFDEETAACGRVYYDNNGLGEVPVTYSGFTVAPGTALSFKPAQQDATVLSRVTFGGKLVRAGKTFVANKDVVVKAERKAAKIKGMPATLSLGKKGDSSKFIARVQYTGTLDKYKPVYDPSIRYMPSDYSLLKVDEDGKITVIGDVPEGGKIVTVTAYAGSGNYQVKATCKVAVGNPDKAKKAGLLTIYARTITAEEMVPHSSLVFTTYEDVDLSVSYYEYHEPTEKYKALVEDYRDHPENYSFDPVLHNHGELDEQLGDRGAYFNLIHRGPESEPTTVSLKAGESISMSNYDFTGNKLWTLLQTMKGSTLSQLPAGQKIIEEAENYFAGKEVTPAAFDALMGTIATMFAYAKEYGVNPIDSHTDGGLALNREMRNQFIYDEYLAPNYYYQIEITKDELAILEDYISNPENNYYSLFNMNCSSGVVEMWNRVTAEHEGLALHTKLTGVAWDPQSVYFELARFSLKSGLDGQSGKDYRPRTIAYKENQEPETVTLSAEKKTLKVGKSFELKAEVAPAHSGHVEFESSNTAVATVDAVGRVTAVGIGKATITATTANGVSASCEVKVKGVTVYQLVKNGMTRYTTRVKNAKLLIKAGWDYVKSFQSAGESETKVYEIYYKKIKTFVYTTSRAVALAAKKAGNKVKVAFFGSDKTDTPVYEVTDGENSFFSLSRSAIRKLRTLGWIYKGIAWYAESGAKS